MENPIVYDFFHFSASPLLLRIKLYDNPQKNLDFLNKFKLALV